VRFLLIDRILELESGKRATGIKNVTMSEDFFAYHFPDMPIMPGMLITESLVQLADWVIRESSDFTCLSLVTGFERLKFRQIVRPGDQLRLEVEIVTWEGQQAVVKGKAFCDGKLVTATDFTLAVQPVEPWLTPGEARRLFQMIHPVPAS